jgi:hypothetical protein
MRITLDAVSGDEGDEELRTLAETVALVARD